MNSPTMPQRLWAEFLGTFWLVFAGCGSAVLAAKFLTEDQVQLGIGFLGVSLAFGLSVVTGAYALGVAWFAGSAALGQVWLFILAPIVGAIVAGVSYGALTGDNGLIETAVAGEAKQREADAA